MAIGLIPFIFLNGELATLQRRLASPDQVWTTFVVGTAITGVFGFLLGIAIKASFLFVTSPVSHMFSAAAKSVIQMMLGVFFFGDVITTYRLGAITLITGGTMLYLDTIQCTPNNPCSEK
ncbi:TPT domain-containing protein [Mycena sanguinolenta]|uniref:TPT domain-containing protein n=1 Tax=Mycena sanguinolenta TaxID=230812 RepID=A0A8H7DLC9_9AGAR|nr:TPT domain-containing protein [Mycena sanguinolenta]